MNATHRALIALTGGRVGWTVLRMPVLELTTTGRRSGRPRSLMLTAPVVEGERLVVVASRGGDPAHPAWFLNVKANPRVMVALGGREAVPMVAHIAEGEERDRLWRRITRDHQNYADYQTRTARRIPVVVLAPAAAPAPPYPAAPAAV